MSGRIHHRKGAHWTMQRTVVPKEERTSPDGILHRTKAECTRWNRLKWLEAQGLIIDLHREIRLPLQSPDGKIVIRGIESGRVLTYTPDFIYMRRLDDSSDWTRIYEDIKGFMTDTQKLRLAVFEALYGVKVFVNKV